MPRAILLILLAAYLLACSERAAPGATGCDGPFTDIAAVQGEGYASPMRDAAVAVSGVVTRVEPGKGFYLEDIGATWPATASRALFVQFNGSPAVNAGHVVADRGRVAETGAGRDTLTSLIDAEVAGRWGRRNFLSFNIGVLLASSFEKDRRP